MFSHEIDKIFKNTFSYRTLLVAASEIKKVFNFQGFLLQLTFCLKREALQITQISFASNGNWKKKHSLAKYVIRATEICRMKIGLKASLLLSCRTHLFFSPRRCFYFPSYVRLFVLFPCYPLQKEWRQKMFFFILLLKETLELNTLDF